MTTINEMQAGDVITRVRVGGSGNKIAYWVEQVGEGRAQGQTVPMAMLKDRNGRKVLTTDLPVDGDTFVHTIVAHTSFEDYKKMVDGAGILREV